jgi:Uma2 family endonuclease
MTTAECNPVAGLARYCNFAEWLHDLGDIPLERIIMDPWLGTATEADLLRKVEVEKQLCELVDGTLIEKPMGYLESRIAAALIEFLGAFVRRHKLGHVTGEAGLMRLSRGLVRIPDVAFVSFERFPNGKIPRAPIPSLAPDLAVEILSKSNTAREMKRKVKEYFAAGSRAVWLIDADQRTARVYETATRATEISRSGVLSGGTVVPGFSLSMRKLFEGIETE